VTDEQKLRRIYDLVDLLADSHFGSGELPIENAYGLTFLIRALVGQLLGFDGAEEEVDRLHGHHGCSRVIFPDEIALRNHLHGLFELKGILGENEDNRDTLFFIQEGRDGSELAKDGKPYLQLVPPMS